MVTHPGPIEGVLKTVYHQLAALARPVIVATCGAYCRLYELVSSKLDGLQQTFALTPKKQRMLEYCMYYTLFGACKRTMEIVERTWCIT